MPFLVASLAKNLKWVGSTAHEDKFLCRISFSSRQQTIANGIQPQPSQQPLFQQTKDLTSRSQDAVHLSHRGCNNLLCSASACSTHPTAVRARSLPSAGNGLPSPLSHVISHDPNSFTLSILQGVVNGSKLDCPLVNEASDIGSATLLAIPLYPPYRNALFRLQSRYQPWRGQSSSALSPRRSRGAGTPIQL